MTERPGHNSVPTREETIGFLEALVMLKRGAPLHDNSDVEAWWLEKAIWHLKDCK